MEPPKKDFAMFLQSTAVGADGSIRKSSPAIPSPLPSTPGGPPLAPPNGELRFKKQNRHVKTHSQPIKVDAEQMRREHEESKQRAAIKEFRQQSVDDDVKSRETSEPESHNGKTNGSTLQEDLMLSQGSSSTIDESMRVKKGSGISIKKTLQKMTLVRSSTDRSKGSAISSPALSAAARSRSPSKDSTIGGRRRALVMKLGMGKLLARRDSDEPTDDSDFQLNTSSPSAFSTQEKPLVSALSMPPALASSSSVPTPSNGSRRSSATNTGELVNIPQSRRPDIMIDVARDKASAYARADLSPMFLNEKNISLSNIKDKVSTDLMSESVITASKQQELDRLKREHTELELHMVKKNSRLANQVGKAIVGRSKRSSAGATEVEIQLETMRLATLRIQIQNEQRLKELAAMIPALEKKSADIEAIAKRIRDTLLEPCRQLVKTTATLREEMGADRKETTEKIAEFEHKHKKLDDDMKWEVEERVSNALERRQKPFTDKVKEAEDRLVKLKNGGIDTGQSGWLVSMLDSSAHSLIELVLLGIGTLLSFSSSLFVWVKSLLGFRSQNRGRPAAIRRRIA